MGVGGDNEDDNLMGLRAERDLGYWNYCGSGAFVYELPLINVA